MSQAASQVGSEQAAELEILRSENAELRAKFDEIEQAWNERQREYESLLEEKSEVIRALHLKIQQWQEAASGGGAPGAEGAPQAGPVNNAEEHQKLLQLKRELDAQRHQLAEDEEALMVQMREMEMSMSRERAELARQRNELARIQSDLNRELEMASRDGGLRDRLAALQRRQEEAASVSNQTPTAKKTSSGLLRRIFG
jgi:DNA repair exonuclease SbcCD ATPase subunit